MARYQYLPVWKQAVDLNRLLEEAVRRFSRYHKYALGTDLRRQAYRVCRLIVVTANSDAHTWSDPFTSLSQYLPGALVSEKAYSEV